MGVGRRISLSHPKLAFTSSDLIKYIITFHQQKSQGRIRTTLIPEKDTKTPGFFRFIMSANINEDEINPDN